jgi:hypothetical protein
MRILASAVACLVLTASARAEAPVEVMILGTYHMGNPGLDLHNVEADDVLKPDRQEQLQAVADGLARFKPTRIAIEWKADDLPMHAVPAYHDYLDGKRDESRNEIDQIAFRLAKELQLAEVYGIDSDGNFPYEEVEAFAKATNRTAELQQVTQVVEKKVKAFSASQSSKSIGELLYAMNSPGTIREDYFFYMKLLAFGDANAQPGAELVGEWEKRNWRICARLVQTVKAGDRVVVVYGSGHSKPLRQCVLDMPNWKLVEPNDFLPH